MSVTRTELAHQRKAVIVYDGQCPLCQRSVRLLRRMDSFERLDFADARDPEQWPESRVELDADRVLEEMHLVTPDGREVYAGFEAFRWTAARVPLLWGLYPLLYFPGVPWAGRRIYRWVAKNRFGLVPCHDGACELPADRSLTARGR